MRQIEYLSEEEINAYRRYQRKRRGGNLSEATDEERAANRKLGQIQRRLNPLQSRYATTKGRAKRENIEFTLTLEDFILLCNSTPVCPLLGIPLDYSAGYGRGQQPNTASLDRKDSTKGYTKANCWIISHKANRMKNDATTDELKLLVQALERLNNVTTV